MTAGSASIQETTARETVRDRGLVRAIGGVAFAAAIINVVVGAGIFSLPGRMAAAAGPDAWIAYLACAVGVGAVMICFAEAGSRVPTSGGTYGYVQAAFGPATGFVAGMLLWISCVLANAGIADALAATLGGLLPALRGPVARALIIAVVIGGLAAVNLAGAGRAARLLLWGTVVKLVPLAVVVLVGVWFVHGANLHAGGVAQGGIGRAIILSLFAFQGAETTIAASGEVADPARTVPRALLGAMGAVAVLYVALQLVTQGLLGARLAGAANPLADAMATVDPRLGVLLLAGAALSMLFWIGADILGAPRVLFAFARDGLLPRALGRVDPRTGVPHVAVIVHSALALALAITGSFEPLAVLSVLAATTLYLMGSGAAWRLRHRDTAVAGAPLRIPGLPAAAVVAIASCAVLIALAEPAEIAGLAAAVVLSLVIYAAARALTRRGAPRPD